MPDGFWGIFFDSWGGLGRILVVGTLAYLALVFFLRVSGKRTLSQLNAFDLIVTVALGSTMASIILSKDVALLEGILTFALLIGLQYVISELTIRSSKFGGLVKSDPALLFYRGSFLSESMRAERLVEAEIRAGIRSQGIASLDEVEAVVLETNGKLSVISRPEGEASALKGVSRTTDRSGVGA
ncbi:MAG TPA: YetF domain-containing protein [Thermomicrobiales bacterium]|jgi:uncharacterized membrane protein YcaP (DUF421 family)|nr:YetF domain-containing protein [Thermomicrobiales bacterium]